MRIIPWRVKEAVRVLTAPRVKHVKEKTGFWCPLCDGQDVVFRPLPEKYARMHDKHGYIHSIYLTETMNRYAYMCSKCRGSDRYRLYALYMLRLLEDGGVINNVLDIAPRESFTKFLRRIGCDAMRTMDLYNTATDDQFDIQNMCGYRDEQYDVFICSHVLEHVPDDIAAMRELHRVLKAGGWGIAMSPVNLGLSEVYENPEITDVAGRWKHFGQDDHVRLYSKEGFISRLQSVGFKVSQYGMEFFGEETFREAGIHPRSVLYVVSK